MFIHHLLSRDRFCSTTLFARCRQQHLQVNLRYYLILSRNENTFFSKMHLPVNIPWSSVIMFWRHLSVCLYVCMYVCPCMYMCEQKIKKCYHIWPLYLFYFAGETMRGVGGLRFEGDDWKRSSTFWRKNCTPRENHGYSPDSGWLGFRIFWPWNDPAPLLRWRRHCIDTKKHLFTS